MIVAVDTMASCTGGRSTVFSNWLKNFTFTVFIQTFHAVYMVVILQVLSSLYKYSAVGDPSKEVQEWANSSLSETQVAILTIVLTTGLVKLEKLLKQLFNIGDSLAGDLKGATKGMMGKSRGMMKGVMAATRAIGDNKAKYSDAGKRKQAAALKLRQLKGAMAGTTTNNQTTNTTINTGGGAKTRAGTTSKPVPGGSGGGGSGTGGVNNSSNDYLRQILEALKNPSGLTKEQQIQQAEEEYARAVAAEKAAGFAKKMSVANTVAGFGLALGMTGDVGEAVFKGGHYTALLDGAAERIGYRAADKDRKTFSEYEQSEGKKYGYEASENIIREKSAVEQVIVNPKLMIDPIAVGKEIGKQFKGVGDILSDSVKKELKNLDRNLDDSQ